MPRYERLMRRADRKYDQADKARSKGKIRKMERKYKKAQKLEQKARACPRKSRIYRGRKYVGCAVNPRMMAKKKPKMAMKKETTSSFSNRA